MGNEADDSGPEPGSTTTTIPTTFTLQSISPCTSPPINADSSSVLITNITKKKTRRSLRKKPTELVVYYCNVNGFQSKKESIINSVKKLQPKIIILCETKLPSNSAIKKSFPDYEVCAKPTKAGKSGLAICVKLQTFQSVLDVTSSELNDILAVRIDTGKHVFRVILGYAPQETEVAEERELFYNELEVEITKCKMADEIPFAIGDMNAKISNGNDQITHDSPNGKLLLEVVDAQQLDVLNFHQKCKGKWTHVIRTTGASSVLDYIMTSRFISDCICELIIDEDCLFCPFRIKKNNGKIEPQFSDHNAIIVKLLISHQPKKSISPPRRWKLTEDGLNRFQQVTTNQLDTQLPKGDVQSKYDQTEKKLNTAMEECFWKSKRKQQSKQLPEKYLQKYKAITLFAKKGKAQRKAARMYIQEIIKLNTDEVAIANKETIKQNLRNLTIDNKFSPDQFWKMCRRSKRNSTNSTSVINEKGVELFGEDVISNEYSKEFQHRLRKRDIIPELKNFETRTEQICQLRLEETKTQTEEPYSRGELQIIKKSMKKGKSSGRDLFPPDVFIRGGFQMDTLILNIFNEMKSSNFVPHQWTQVLIATIYKNKGSKKVLVNHRGIFLKQILSKMFEKMNMNRMSGKLDTIDKFQGGSRTGKGPPDQTFLLRATVDHSKYIKKPLYITLYDYSQCFDALWLSDCLMCLWNLGVKSESLNNIKKLNEICNFVVKTPFGVSKESNVTSIVQQGSVSGGALCSASTAEITKEELGNGCQIGLSNIKCLVYVDDIAGTNNTIHDTYTSHNSVVWFSAKKRLALNASKCMIMGVNRKCTDIMPQLKIDGEVIRSMKSVVYLGDHFNSNGSNCDLIIDRIKKGKACIITATSLCDDVTMGVYAIQTLMILYVSLFLAVVLYNSQAWTKLTGKEIEKLQAVQLKYLKRIFHCPSSTPNSLTFLETGTIPVEQEIHIRQLGFLRHILSLSTNDPVKLVYKQLLSYDYEENWANEVKEIREKYELFYTDFEIAKMTKTRWKLTVKDQVTKYSINLLNSELSKLKHCNIQPSDKLKQQDYMTSIPPPHSRAIFQIRTGVIDFKMCRKHVYNDTCCRLCGSVNEDVHHVINICPMVTRNSCFRSLFYNNMVDAREIANRCIEFTKKVKDQ